MFLLHKSENEKAAAANCTENIVFVETYVKNFVKHHFGEDNGEDKDSYANENYVRLHHFLLIVAPVFPQKSFLNNSGGVNSICRNCWMNFYFSSCIWHFFADEKHFNV